MHHINEFYVDSASELLQDSLTVTNILHRPLNSDFRGVVQAVFASLLYFENLMWVLVWCLNILKDAAGWSAFNMEIDFQCSNAIVLHFLFWMELKICGLRKKNTDLWSRSVTAPQNIAGNWSLQLSLLAAPTLGELGTGLGAESRFNGLVNITIILLL